MEYKLSIVSTTEHFIKIEWKIDEINTDIMHLQLPAWRPGRYELQNYAKNIRAFTITSKGKPVPYHKINKDRWQVDVKGCKDITVEYEYYANQLDAGASYVCETFLYVNPVNCFMYVEGREKENCLLDLVIPDAYKVATQMQVKGQTLSAPHFDSFADSPFIASANMLHESFEVEGSTINLWFEGAHPFNMEMLIHDTIAYTRAQIHMFREMPSKDYHFLYIMLPQRFHHGVEHADSTVIAMGAGEELSDEFYDEFISISSHELFHLWNVKRIRPASMLPYDFTKENYSTMGYVYEGVTTYYGDLMLLRSGVWSWEQFASKFNLQLLKHFSNPGRFNYSVAESSFDTWLDGYVPGVPGRKVSIYVEGMLAAVIADILIISHSKGKYSFDDVLRGLYDLYKQGKGYTESDYCGLLEKFSGISFREYFNDVIRGRSHIERYLVKTLAVVGCGLHYSEKGVFIVKQAAEDNALFTKWTSNRS